MRKRLYSLVPVTALGVIGLGHGLSLAQNNGTAAPANGAQTTETTRVEVVETERTTTTDAPRVQPRWWDIDAPIQLDASVTQTPGTLQLHNIIDYSTASDGTDDDVAYVVRLEWGFAPNHDLELQVPVELGDSRVEGNADITLRWQWQIIEEADAMPGIGLMNSLRIPSGYHSSGVDWELKGLVTKTLVPDQFRLHANPFLRLLNGDNDRYLSGDVPFESQRHFQWGFIFGFDWKITDDLILLADYVHEAADTYGWRNQHSAEVALQWRLTDHVSIAWATQFTLDGDGLERNWGTAFNYIWTFDNFPACGVE